MNLASVYDIFVTEETNPSTSFINKPIENSANTRRVRLKSSLQIPNNLPAICINLQLVGFNASYRKKNQHKICRLAVSLRRSSRIETSGFPGKIRRVRDWERAISQQRRPTSASASLLIRKNLSFWYIHGILGTA